MLAECESADSLSARCRVLGSYGDGGPSSAGRGRGVIASMRADTRAAVSRLEEILEAYRDGASPDRTEFLALQHRLAEYGIEDELDSDPAPRAPDDEDDDDD